MVKYIVSELLYQNLYLVFTRLFNFAEGGLVARAHSRT